MKTTFSNRLAFVTGASQGIGKAIARELVSRGCGVVGVALESSPLHEAGQELRGLVRNDDQIVEILACDVTDPNAVSALVDDTIERHGVPDLLINCAGFARPGYLHEQPLSDLRAMMDLNYFGIVHTCKALLPRMLERGSGSILNTASMAGILGLFGYTGYSASKFAVMGFSQALRREVAPSGVHVAVLCPPNTRTPGLERENRSKPSEVLATEERIKTVTPEFVAQAAVRGLAARKNLIIPTFDGKLVYWLERLAPWFIEGWVKR